MTGFHHSVAAAGLLIPLVFAGTADAALHLRLDGAAAYDDILDITWLTDAGLSPNDTGNLPSSNATLY